MSQRVSVRSLDPSTNPNESDPLWPALSQTAIGDLSARCTRSSPPPIRVIGATRPGWSAGLVNTVVSAVFMSTALISSGERPGKALLSSAAAPETIGVAPDVPPNPCVSVPLPLTADTEAPGAPISGLMRFRESGPRDDVPAMLPTSLTKVALETLAVTVAGMASWSMMSSPSDCWMTTVGTNVSPPP